MAYKFQLGPATLSGSLTQEGDISALGGALSGSGNLLVGGTVRLDGVADAEIAVSTDSLYYLDGDGLMKKERLSDYAAAIAGDALSSSNGVLAVGVDDSTIEINSDVVRLKDDGVTGAKLAPAVAGAGLAQDGSGNLDIGAATNGGIAVNANDIGLDLNDLSAADVAVASDSIAIIDSDDNTTKKESIADLMTAAAGDGLVASSGVLAVQVSGAVRIASDKVSISGSITGDALDFAGGVDSISTIHVVADESTINSAGLAALKVADNGITATQIATSVAGNGLSGGGGTALALDLNELNAATVDLTADSMAIIDSDDSNGSKKESLADLVAAMAGAGLTQNASTKKLEVQSSAVSASANSATLVEGVNYFAAITSDASVNLPASPSTGDKVTVKAGAFNGSAKKITINRQGSHTIDGSNTSVEIESDFGAISFVYVAANDWRII